jgi:RHS repeat-associated protein
MGAERPWVNPDPEVSGSNTYYYLPDGLGSTMAMVDGSGTVVKTYGYDAYGKVTSSSGTAPNEFDFAGQQTDPTGLQYLRARYYDPETGRFLSRDPLSAIPAWDDNPFAYATANPATLLDPWGLCVFGLWCPPIDIDEAVGLTCDVLLAPIPCSETLELVKNLRSPGSESIGLDEIQLVGEYLILGNVRFNVFNNKNGITELKSDDPISNAAKIFKDMAKRNGAKITKVDNKRLMFRTKSGLQVNLRFDAKGNPTIHIQGRKGGEIKLKFTRK